MEAVEVNGMALKYEHYMPSSLLVLCLVNFDLYSLVVRCSGTPRKLFAVTH